MTPTGVWMMVRMNEGVLGGGAVGGDGGGRGDGGGGGDGGGCGDGRRDRGQGATNSE